MMNAANSEGENDLPNDDDEEEDKKKLLAIHFFDIAHVQPHFAQKIDISSAI